MSYQEILDEVEGHVAPPLPTFTQDEIVRFFGIEILLWKRRGGVKPSTRAALNTLQRWVYLASKPIVARGIQEWLK